MSAAPIDPSHPRSATHSASGATGSVALEQAALQLQLDAAVQVGQVGIWRHDLRSGQVAFNEIAAAAFPCAPGQRVLSLEAVLACIHPEDLPLLKSSAAQALECSEPVPFDMRLRDARTGRWRHLRTRRIAERDASGNPVAYLGVSVDITGPLEEGRRARTMVRRLELVGQAAGMGFWAVRRGAQEAYWGPHLYVMHGLPPEEPPPPLRRWLHDHVHPQDRAEVRRTLLSGLRALDTPQETSFRLIHRDGSIRHVIAHTRVEQLGADAARPFGLLIDVTERYAAQEALRRSTGRAQLIAHAVGLGTWEHDLISGHCEWDEQMWRLRGLEPKAEAPDGEARRCLVYPDDRAVTDHALHSGSAAAQALEYEFRVVWPDGSVRWLASRSSAECDSQGRPVRRIGVNWDVTEARKLRAAHEEKLAAQRELQAKSQFLSRMSHELRTPLNAVLGFAQLMLDDEQLIDARTRRQRLEQIRSAGQHLLALIDDVLDLSRLEGGEMAIALESVALPALLDSVLPLVEPLAAEHHVHISRDIAPAAARADPTRLRQVLLNLLSNAIKYNRPGGQVFVEAFTSGDICRLRVRDTGPGLTAEQRQHLFEPFNRLGAERSGVPGTGIGLAIVKALVERMGGTVHVETAPGQGTCFELRLPDGAASLAPSAAKAGPRMRAMAAGALAERGRQGRILYVEDNPVNTMIVEELVQRRPDLQMRSAENGALGLELACSWQPDLILLDMQLPDMAGEQVFAALQADARCAHTPCIALSANAMPADIDRALSSGFTDYWTKPLDFGVFQAAIDTLFGPHGAPAHGAALQASSPLGGSH